MHPYEIRIRKDTYELQIQLSAASAALKLGAEGVPQLTFSGQTYVLRPDWAGAGTASGTPRIGVDEQGRIVFQVGSGPGQPLLPALLDTAQASSIFSTTIPSSTLAVQPGSSKVRSTLTLAGQRRRLVPHWVLPGNDAAQTTPWRYLLDCQRPPGLGNIACQLTSWHPPLPCASKFRPRHAGVFVFDRAGLNGPVSPAAGAGRRS